jgi:pimeloyl-ACP methyl ester carboxylesterase
MTVKDAATDLYNLLKAAKVRGPYVIVGQSLGGLIAKLYAAMYPNDICGLAFVDALVDTVKDLWTPEQFDVFKHAMKFVPKEVGGYQDLERLDVESSFQQIGEASMAPLSTIPAIVLTSDQSVDIKYVIKAGIYPSSMTVKTGKQLWKHRAQHRIAWLSYFHLSLNTPRTQIVITIYKKKIPKLFLVLFERL